MLPVSSIAGLTNTIIKRLNETGIFTAQQLMEKKSTIKIAGISTERLLGLTTAAIGGTKRTNAEISSHSWRNIIVHVTRAKGHLVRGQVGSLVVKDYQVALRITLPKNIEILVHPVSIAALRTLWLNKDVVSDDSDNESTKPVPAHQTKLPKLVIQNADELVTFTEAELQAIQTILRETNQLLKLVV